MKKVSSIGNEKVIWRRKKNFSFLPGSLYHTAYPHHCGQLQQVDCDSCISFVEYWKAHSRQSLEDTEEKLQGLQMLSHLAYSTLADRDKHFATQDGAAVNYWI